MPAILGFVLFIFLIYLAVSFIIPTIAGVFATMVIGKTAKLEFEDTFALAIYFYLIQAVLFGLLMVFENDPQAWWSTLLYFLAGFIWPLPYSFILFGQTAGEDILVGVGLLACSFVITQLIAIMMILKKARAETDNL